MRVLIADDSAALRKVQRSVLQSMGHASDEILEAEDGNAVVALYRTPGFDVDLILADGDLRGMDGLSLLRFLKSLAPPRATPVVLCVNSSQRYVVTEGAKLGLRDYVVRPFTDEELRRKIGAIEAVIEVQKSQMATDFLKTLVSTADVDLPFLLQLPSALMEDFLAAGASTKHDAGSVLLQAGDPVDALHVVTSGDVELLPEGGSRPGVVVGTGETFGEVQFMAGGTIPVSVVAKSKVEILSVGRVQVGELVRRHPRLADQLGALAARKSKQSTGRRRSGHESEFFGSFRSMLFSDVIQLMQVSQKNGLLSIEGKGRTGGIVLVGGEVKHAWAGEKAGDEAFYELASWKDASFTFASGPQDAAPTIGQPTIMLLMEAMRRLDEAGREPAAVRAAG